MAAKLVALPLANAVKLLAAPARGVLGGFFANAVGRERGLDDLCLSLCELALRVLI